MIKEVKMFTIICDGCKKDVNADADYSCWNDVSYLDEIRQDSGWEKVGEKHYCTNCFDYDENDELIIRNK